MRVLWFAHQSGRITPYTGEVNIKDPALALPIVTAFLRAAADAGSFYFKQHGCDRGTWKVELRWNFRRTDGFDADFERKTYEVNVE